ncbi:ParA family protein [Candidatus Dojkabacteria bacterium]|uniref:ParA family protein n=1 Tax=Candidatus Dojkabacteria bacterium TaxID=2099670 RepID=A0A955RLP2_9BACT|nr:ParA family protein [Candidatus Dojkabacteria bacterium]
MIIAVTNQKGGVGKTTSVLNIGVFLAKKGKKVLLVDIDPQANLTSGLGIERDRENDGFISIYDVLVNQEEVKSSIKKSRVENLSVIPSSIELAGAEVEMVNAMSRESVLKKALDQVKDEFDYIIIDCPPSLGLLTINSQVAADLVVIPVQAEYYALEGLGQLMNTIKLVKSNLNPNLDIGGVVLTMFDSRTNLSKDIALELKNHFDDKLFETLVPRNIKLSEAPSHGLAIVEYEPESSGAQAYDRLTQEIIDRFEKNNSKTLVRPKI